MSSAAAEKEVEEKKEIDAEKGDDTDIDQENTHKHSVPHIAAIVGTCVLFVAILFFNYFNSSTDGVIFTNSIGDTSDFFYFEITPSGWAFSIWGVIYTWQVVWLAYAVSTLFRSTSEGRLYVNPPPIPIIVFLIYMSNLIINLAWLFAFDRRIIGLSLAFLAYIPLSLVLCMFFAFRKTTENIAFFKRIDQRWEMILLNILVHNAWAVYLGWTICATLLNFGFVLLYSATPASQELAGAVSLTILILLVLVLCPLELTIFDKHLRYVFAHYLGPIMALTGSVYKQGFTNTNPTHTPSGVNRTYAAVILALVILFLLAKIVAACLRAWKQPLYYSNATNSTSDIKELSPVE